MHALEHLSIGVLTYADYLFLITAIVSKSRDMNSVCSSASLNTVQSLRRNHQTVWNCLQDDRWRQEWLHWSQWVQQSPGGCHETKRSCSESSRSGRLLSPKILSVSFHNPSPLSTLSSPLNSNCLKAPSPCTCLARRAETGSTPRTSTSEFGIHSLSNLID